MAKSKSPETRDRYKIFFEVEINALGHVIAILTKIGMQNVHYELITDVKKFDKQRSYDRPARAVLLEILKDGEPHGNKEFREAFVKEGREPASASTPLAVLLKSGVVKKIGHATYRLTPAGMKAAPAADAEVAKLPKVRAAAGTRRFEANGRDRLMQLMSDGLDHSTKTLGERFVSEGRNKASVSPNLDFMLKRGTVKRVDQGIYRLTAKGLKLAVPKPASNETATASQPAVTNGAGVHADA